jgi:hypothetical protein
MPSSVASSAIRRTHAVDTPCFSAYCFREWRSSLLAPPYISSRRLHIRTQSSTRSPRALACGECKLCWVASLVCLYEVYKSTCFHPSCGRPLGAERPSYCGTLSTPTSSTPFRNVIHTILEPCPRVQANLVYLYFAIHNKRTNNLEPLECHVFLKLWMVSYSISRG